MRGQGFQKIVVLGSGTGLSSSRYWSGFVVDNDILLDAPPTVGIHLRRVGMGARDLRYIFVSHLHADHVFGLIFLCLEFHFETRRQEPLTVIGPVGIQEHVERLYRLAYPYEGRAPASAYPLLLQFREIGGAVEAVFHDLSYRAIPMLHHPTLIQSYGFRLTRGGYTIAYSGDTAMVPQLLELAAGANILIVECTNITGNRGDHLNPDDIQTLRTLLPSSTQILVTHTQGVVQQQLPSGTTLVNDFDLISLA